MLYVRILISYTQTHKERLIIIPVEHVGERGQGGWAHGVDRGQDAHPGLVHVGTGLPVGPGTSLEPRMWFWL